MHLRSIFEVKLNKKHKENPVYYRQNKIVLRILWKRKIAKCSIFSNLAISSVGVPGLEPGKAGPESAVLPLHHTPKSLQPDNLIRIAGAKVRYFLELPKLFVDFL